MNRLNTNYFDNFYIDWQNNEISENYVEFCQKQINNLSHIVPSLKKEKRKIIDTCCGCGFHSKFLIDKGHHVISFDKSEEMLNFAYKKNDLKNLLRNSYTSLKKGGILIIDLMNPAFFYKNFEEQMIFNFKDYEVNQTIKINKIYNSIVSTWDVYKNNEYSKDLSRELKFKLYTTNDIICSSLYYNFTLSNISFYGDMKGNEFHENSPRLIVKITK
ncbi:class I SAM-dependent methyltransferase [Staphylococcus aureus]|nr:class I SAM-dependent methyltransferase [Staphylococcus aureus]MBG1002194.1 class I SAM-dependent methyltransferase [Staphylococcus aureus]MBG1131859.1 class I SAM-dependent methyltransferase [Staphylococcus aureus]MBG1143644.1 class I SAM-dependent methyltransferase [Staphylococcus aureus]HCW8721239.1 class I SAM-dependent methyltransferase [Staphylococcus aureus]